MRHEFSNNSEKLFAYIEKLSVKETKVQKELRETTSHLELAIMQISPIQGQFLTFLVQLTNAKKCLEIGTFTGYSALSITKSLSPEGRLTTCDINEDWTKIATEAWEKAGVMDKITLKLAPATDTLNHLLETEKSTFDFIFIDADKTNYVTYYQSALSLVRPGGLIVIDNIFWDGKVIDPEYTDDRQTKAIRELNDIISKDPRVTSCMVPIADGLCLVNVL